MKYSICILVAILTFVGSSFGFTVATFSDPSTDGLTPLFEINSTTKTITGGWSDGQTGLDLIIPYTSKTYNDAFFTMTPLTMSTGVLVYDTTGPGTIQFFANGASADPLAIPIFQIDFDSANITFGSLHGDNIFSANGVVFSGSEIGNSLLSEEVFAFSFANLEALTGNDIGYTATAAFTSSAVPEPATIALLGLGSMSLLRRRKKAC